MEKPSFYSGVRRLLKWARNESSSTLCAAITNIAAKSIRPEHIGVKKLSVALPDDALREIRILKKELAARKRAQNVVSDLCASAKGQPYGGTSGWWITPMLTNNGTIGLLDTTRGLALDTGVKLSLSERMAVTLPPGKLGHWNMAAESHVAEFPAGWRQLACDSRGGTVKPRSEIMPMAKIVSSGLKTCYGSYGDKNEKYERSVEFPR